MQKSDEINLWDLILILVKRKSMIIFMTLSFMAAGVLLALLSPPYYSVTTVIGATEESKSPPSLGSLSGLTSIFGANLSFLTGGDNLQTIRQTLHSSDFLFYADEKIRISALLGRHFTTKEEKLQFLRTLVVVREDAVNGTISISMESRDPKLSYSVMNKLMSTLNEYVIKRQSDQSRMLVQQLRKEIQVTSDPILRSELSSLWATEAKKLILSQINKNNMYQIVERPFIPDQRTRPKRKLIVMVSVFLGFFTGVILAFAGDYFKRMSADPETRAYLDKIAYYLGPKKGRK